MRAAAAFQIFGPHPEAQFVRGSGLDHDRLPDVVQLSLLIGAKADLEAPAAAVFDGGVARGVKFRVRAKDLPAEPRILFIADAAFEPAVGDRIRFGVSVHTDLLGKLERLGEMPLFVKPLGDDRDELRMSGLGRVVEFVPDPERIGGLPACTVEQRETGVNIGLVGDHLLEFGRIFAKVFPGERKHLFTIGLIILGGGLKLGKRLVGAALPQEEITELPTRKSVGRGQCDRLPERRLGPVVHFGLLIGTAELDPPAKIVRRQPHRVLVQLDCGACAFGREDIAFEIGLKPERDRVGRCHRPCKFGRRRSIRVGGRRHFGDHSAELAANGDPTEQQRDRDHRRQYYLGFRCR